jgi:hypothetical protein
MACGRTNKPSLGCKTFFESTDYSLCLLGGFLSCFSLQVTTDHLSLQITPLASDSSQYIITCKLIVVFRSQVIDVHILTAFVHEA